MDKKIKYALNYLNEPPAPLYCNDVDQDEYTSKYKGHLKCINGCEAKIKFTHRKNNIKFFSTWNKEGHLHSTECPYHVDYKGRKGRKKLQAYYENGTLDEGYIERGLRWKAASLQKEYDKSKITDPQNGSVEVDIIGEEEAPVYVDDNSLNQQSEKRPYISSQDSKYLTADDDHRRIRVYGNAITSYIGINEDGSRYGYINLENGILPVSLVFTEAFYRYETINGLDDFERFMGILDKQINSEHNTTDFFVVSYGEIRYVRKKKGLNVYITTPGRIIINNMTVKQIIAQGKILPR